MLTSPSLRTSVQFPTSKLVEKAASLQLTQYDMTNRLSEEFQSAYKAFNSTETALLKVQNDILRALDRNESVILLLLDLSAGFDTVDHVMLLSRLSHHFSSKGTALDWLTSYLSSRIYFFSYKATLLRTSCSSLEH